MGTSSAVKFVKANSDNDINDMTIYATICHHWDGYIDGVGHTLAKWLINHKMINGIKYDQYTDEYCNGIGCLAAKYVHDFKTETGDLYLCPSDVTRDYNYYVIIREKNIISDGTPINDIAQIFVKCFDKVIFYGRPSELLEFNEDDYE